MPLTEEQISATMAAHPVTHEPHTAYMREVLGHGVSPESARSMLDSLEAAGVDTGMGGPISDLRDLAADEEDGEVAKPDAGDIAVERWLAIYIGVSWKPVKGKRMPLDIDAGSVAIDPSPDADPIMSRAARADDEEDAERFDGLS